MKVSHVLLAGFLISALWLFGCTGAEPSVDEISITNAGDDHPIRTTAAAEPSATTAAPTPPVEESSAATLPRATTLEERPRSSANSEDPDTQQDLLEQYVSQVSELVPGLLESHGGLYSDIRFEAIQPGTIKFVYVYAEWIDPDYASDFLDGMAPTFQTLFETQVWPEMVTYGITDSPSMEYTYRNPDESEIWSQTFTKSD